MEGAIGRRNRVQKCSWLLGRRGVISSSLAKPGHWSPKPLPRSFFLAFLPCKSARVLRRAMQSGWSAPKAPSTIDIALAFRSSPSSSLSCHQQSVGGRYSSPFRTITGMIPHEGHVYQCARCILAKDWSTGVIIPNHSNTSSPPQSVALHVR